jgi:hypothetical protein
MLLEIQQLGSSMRKSLPKSPPQVLGIPTVAILGLAVGFANFWWQEEFSAASGMQAYAAQSELMLSFDPQGQLIRYQQLHNSLC